MHEEGRDYEAFELDFEVDNQKPIDWEQRRYELIRDFESALLSNPEIMSISGVQKGCKDVLESVFDIADNIILKLKQE